MDKFVAMFSWMAGLKRIGNPIKRFHYLRRSKGTQRRLVKGQGVLAVFLYQRVRVYLSPFHESFKLV